MTTPSSVLEDPPPYPGPNSVFALPPYETATSLDTWADSYCLPPYQSRTGQRFHPYMRILPIRRVQQEESFEEFLRSLQTSTDHRAMAPPVVAGPPFVATTSTPPCPPAPSTNRQALPPIAVPLAAPGLPLPPPPRLLAQDPGVGPAERRGSLIRRLFFLPEIIRIIRAGLGAAMRAAEAQKRKMIPAARR